MKEILHRLYLAKRAEAIAKGCNIEIAFWSKMAEGVMQKAKAYCIAEIRLKHPNAYMVWHTKDDQRLLKLSQFKGIEELAQIMGRQPGGIRSRLHKLKEGIV